MEIADYIALKEIENLRAHVCEADEFISRYVDLESHETFRFESRSPASLDFMQGKNMQAIVNYNRVNDFRYINKFFEAVNKRLGKDGLYIGCVETKTSRKKRVLAKMPLPVNYVWYAVDFTYKRVVPKLPVLKKAYFSITQGNNRLLTMSETTGRLVSCGYKLVDVCEIGYLTWFVARKVSEPVYDMNPTYGAIVGLNRIGYQGEMIKVYKLRTMHPYSEYIQDFMYRNNALKAGGKIDQDVRITNWGRLIRKLWIDEIPMLYNWLRGDVKLVGVRPLSRHYFDLYPEELQQLRIRFKPGLIPPFYRDLPKTLDEIAESERNYLLSYEKKPIRTDIRYFFSSMYNIIIKRARSA